MRGQVRREKLLEKKDGGHRGTCEQVDKRQKCVIEPYGKCGEGKKEEGRQGAIQNWRAHWGPNYGKQ